MAFVAITGLSATAAVPAQGETVTWSYDSKPALLAGTKDGSIPIVTENRAPLFILTRYIVEGASAEDWNEAFEVLNLATRDQPKSLRKWYEAFVAKGDATCASEWKIIDEAALSMVFERLSPPCGQTTAQHGLYRALYGDRDFFVLIATRKPSFSEESRREWLELLESAIMRR